MNLTVLAISILFFIYCYSTYSDYEHPIGDFIYSYTPKKYTIVNKGVQTVTSMSPRKPPAADDKTTQIPNSKYIYSPGKFQIDDSEKLRLLELSCIPESFGYSIEQGNAKFPYHGYPKCSEVNQQNDTYLHIDREKNELYMDCPKGNRGKYIAGPVDERRILRSNELYDKWKVKDYQGPVDAKKIEFGLATCENDDDFMQPAMFPIFNESAFKASKSQVKEGRPRIIFFLTLDSMSRRHSYRKIPKVIDFLNKLNSDPDSEFSVFDYKLHNILGADSISNQVPIFGGLDKFKTSFTGDQNIDYLGDTALWNILRKKGYISLLGLENCDNYFPGAIGRNPNVDYAVGPFYCAIQQFTAMKFDKEFALTQRCVGGHQTHYYILNYTQTLAEMNRGANMWLYLHLNAAHEATGLHAETLNDDITGFLQKFLKDFSKDNDIFLYLNADHGMRYGDWFKEVDAYQENKLPSLFVIASKTLLEKYQYSYHSLATNTERLTSKLDLRKTTLFLVGYAEENPLAVNLINEIAGKSRTCADTGTEPWDCSCNQMKEITNPNPEIHKLLEHLKSYTEKMINSMAYSNPLYPLGKICKKVVLDEITKIYHVGVSNIHEFFKLEITSSTRKNMKFQVNYFIASDGKGMGKLSYQYKPETGAFSSPIQIKILNISRIDKFAGPCELQARKYGIKAEFCACSELN